MTLRLTRDCQLMPTGTVMSLGDDGAAVTVRWDGTELFRYVYRPQDPQPESPRPYFHPVRTLGGELVTGYRPDDHVWHKGISWSLPNVGPDNFWGGPTYRRGDGYIQLPNNGSIRHEEFGAQATDGAQARLEQRLAWVTEPGERLVSERRAIGATAWPDQQAWLLSFETTMHNDSGRVIRIGSPTTEGRENAGYGGLFWRGPPSFGAGHAVTPDGAQPPDSLMGRRGPWLAYTGPDEVQNHWSTLVFRDLPGNPGHPCQWFVRGSLFPCVCPAPFFAAEYPLAAGASLTFRYDVVVADGALGAAACGELAGRAASPGQFASPDSP